MIVDKDTSTRPQTVRKKSESNNLGEPCERLTSQVSVKGHDEGDQCFFQVVSREINVCDQCERLRRRSIVRRRSEGTQEAPRRHPGAPRRHQGAQRRFGGKFDENHRVFLSNVARPTFSHERCEGGCRQVRSLRTKVGEHKCRDRQPHITHSLRVAARTPPAESCLGPLGNK